MFVIVLENSILNCLLQLHTWLTENHNYLFSSTMLYKRKSFDGSSPASSKSLSKNLKETLNKMEEGQFSIIKAMVTGVELSEGCPGKLYGTFCKFDFFFLSQVINEYFMSIIFMVFDIYNITKSIY